MFCSPCKEQWRLSLVSFHHKLIIKLLTQFKVLPQDDNFVNGWESYPEILQNNYWNLETVCSLDDIIKMHWPSWQSCWWTKMGRQQQKCNIPVLLASFCVRCTSFIALKWCKEIVFVVFFIAYISIHHLNFSWCHCTALGGIWHLFVCWELASVNCWWKSSAFLCSSELVYLFNQQLCALGCLCPVKLGLCFHISIREGLHCNSAWSFHSTCSSAYFFICVRPDHHIATELHQFMLGEVPCKCCVLQNAAKISPWLINCSQLSVINTITLRWGCEEKEGEAILTIYHCLKE